MRRRLRAALRRGLDRLIEVEIIGQEACPMMLRWTFFNVGVLKAMIHYFPPNVSDRDPHDHPRPFVTFIFRGRYFNTEWERYAGYALIPTLECIEAGRVCYRPAKHTHIVETDDMGAWSLVIMGPVVREWGFVRRGRWLPWKRYVDMYGGVVRCDAPPDTMSKSG